MNDEINEFDTDEDCISLYDEFHEPEPWEEEEAIGLGYFNDEISLFGRL